MAGTADSAAQAGATAQAGASANEPAVPGDRRWALEVIPLPGDQQLRAPGELSISIHGVPAVRLGEDEVRFATRHAQLAVYLLAIAGPGGLPAEELADTLWHGVVPKRAAQSMRTMLWQTRRSLAHEAWRIRRQRGGLLLDLDGVRLDFQPGEVLQRDRILNGWAFRIPTALQPRLIVAA